LHQRLRLFAGAIQAERRQGVDLAIDLGNPPLQYTNKSSGVTSPELSFSTIAQAVDRISAS